MPTAVVDHPEGRGDYASGRRSARVTSNGSDNAPWSSFSDGFGTEVDRSGSNPVIRVAEN